MASIPVLNLAYCQKACIKFNVTNSCGVNIPITNILWNSSDTSAATVSDSLNSIVLTAQGGGTATITISYDIGVTPFSQQFQVNVTGVTTSLGTPGNTTSPTFAGSLSTTIIPVSNIFSSLVVSSAIPVTDYYGGTPIVSSVPPPQPAPTTPIEQTQPFGTFVIGQPNNITDPIVCNGISG